MILHLYWVNWNFNRAESDADLMYRFLDIARLEIDFGEGENQDDLSEPIKVGLLRHPPSIFQLAVTAALLIAGWFVVQIPTP